MQFRDYILGLVCVAVLVLGAIVYLHDRDSFTPGVGGPDQSHSQGGLELQDRFSEGGEWSTASSTSAASITLPASAITDNIMYVATPNKVGTNMTVTLPASSTLATFLPNPGNSAVWFISNATFEGAATTTTLAAGTGWSVTAATTTSLTIPANGTGMLRIIRATSTNFVGFFQPYR